MGKTKKIIILVVCIVLVCAIIATVLGVTLAKWKEQADATQIINLDIEEYNPSAPYIVYYGLDGDGNFTQYDSQIQSWAVVGYVGLVQEVIIPEIHTERGIEKPVTHILAHEDYLNDRLSGNSIITEITLPSSIVVIGSGVCSMMSELKSVSLEENNENPQKLEIKDLAFAGCGKLEVFENRRLQTEGNSASYLKGTPCMS